MRVAAIRTDIGRVFLNDVESRSQRCFSAEPNGQSRYFEKPTDTEFLNLLNEFAVLSLYGSDSSANVNTSAGNNVLQIRVGSTASYTIISVTSGASVAKTTIATDLNAGFLSNGLPLTARVSSNHLVIDSSVRGPDSFIQVSSLSTLETVVGFSTTAITGVTVSALKAVVYPSATTVDVSSTSLLALGTWQYATTTDQDALCEAIADLVAPHLVETGPVLLSFVYGNLHGFSSSGFQPGGARIGLPAGAALVCLQDDGTTPFAL